MTPNRCAFYIVTGIAIAALLAAEAILGVVTLNLLIFIITVLKGT